MAAARRCRGRLFVSHAQRVVLTAPQPLVVVTAWGIAAAPFLGGLFLAIAAGGWFYRRTLRRASPPSLLGVCAAAAIAMAIAWCMPVLFSSDVYAYAAYGELARLGLNPYAHVPHGLSDPLVRAAQWQWASAFPICLYGPAFVALARLLVTAFAPLGTLAQLDAFRVLACAAFVVCAPLAYYAFPGNRIARLRSAATIGLNPVAIWCAAEGHNDALALAIVLAGFGLVRRGFISVGAALAALSALIKPPGVAAAIGLAVMDRRARAGAAIGITIAALLSVRLVAGIATQLAPHGRYAPEASLQAIFAPLGAIVACIVAGIVCALLALRGITLVRGRIDEGWIWLGLAAWVLIPNPYPWYALWLVALGGLAPRSRVGRVAILLSFTSLLRYLPDAAGTPTATLRIVLGIAASLPLLALRWARYNERLV